MCQLQLFMLRPVTAFWNKDYFTRQACKYLHQLFTKWAQEISEIQKQQGIDFQVESGFYFSDDFMCGLRNLGFLEDPIFIRAVGPRKNDKVLMARIWRLWFTSWSLAQCWKKGGDILDCGTYNGKAFYTSCKYAALLKGDFNRDGNIIAADLFENPPREAQKADHGPGLESSVRQMFLTTFPDTKVIKGYLPNSLDSVTINQISWCQIDLNSAEHDVSTFKYIFDKLQAGAHVIFDDYGFSRYKNTQKMLDNFLDADNSRIFELPTGQGLWIKN